MKGVRYEYVRVIFCVVQSACCVIGEDIQPFEKKKKRREKTWNLEKIISLSLQSNPTLDTWVYECILGKCHIVECGELGGYELRW